jgi:hypothetical protein
MSLELRYVEDAGDITRERVVLRATTNVDIGLYALFRCRVSKDGKPLSGAATAYWFNNKEIRAGDFVVLYTKSGSASQKKGASAATSYFYYWNLTAAHWTTDTVPVLADIPDFEIGHPIE